MEKLSDKPTPVVDKKPNNEEHIRGEKCRKAATSGGEKCRKAATSGGEKCGKAATFSQCHAQNAMHKMPHM